MIIDIEFCLNRIVEKLECVCVCVLQFHVQIDCIRYEIMHNPMKYLHTADLKWATNCWSMNNFSNKSAVSTKRMTKISGILFYSFALQPQRRYSRDDSYERSFVPKKNRRLTSIDTVVALGFSTINATHRQKFNRQYCLIDNHSLYILFCTARKKILASNLNKKMRVFFRNIYWLDDLILCLFN